MCLTFSCDPSEVYFIDEEETCTASIGKLPVEKIEQAGFTQKQALAIIRALIPISVTLEDYYVESSFQFVATEDDIVYDAEKGFASDDGKIGGYFGYYFGSDNEPDLPI